MPRAWPASAWTTSRPRWWTGESTSSTSSTPNATRRSRRSGCAPISATEDSAPSVVAADGVCHQVPQEPLVLAFGRAGEGGLELPLGRLCELAGGGAGAVDAAGASDEIVQPFDVARQALGAGPGQDGAQALLLEGGRAGEGVDQDQGALALPEIPADLLAVLLRLAHQVEDVVLDLEGHPQEVPEAIE